MRSAPSRSWSGWSSLLVALCVGLVLMSGMIQAAHFHADGQTDHDCALCLTVHTVANVAQAIVVHFTARRVETVDPARPMSVPRRVIFFRLASRPPPADSALAA